MVYSSQGPEDGDNVTFQNFHKAIKELTADDGVHLESTLDEYLKSLKEMELSVTVDGQTTNVNFTQAAILVQTSANVYCKKVDSLYNRVRDTILQLGKDANSDASRDTGGRRKKRAGLDRNREFCDFDFDLAKNITEKPTLTLEEKEARFKFLCPTPQRLMEKECADLSVARVDIYSDTLDLIGYKDDFRVNAQYVTRTCRLGDRLVPDHGPALDATVDVGHDDDDSLLNDSGQQPAADRLEATHHEDGGGDHDSVGGAADEGGDNEMMDVSLPPLPDEAGPADLSNLSVVAAGGQRQLRGSRDVLAAAGPPPPAAEPVEPAPDPWQLVDPFLSGKDLKKVRKGKTCKPPKEPQQRTPLMPVEQQIVNEATDAPFRSNLFPGVPAPFHNLAGNERLDELGWEKAQKRKEKKVAHNNENAPVGHPDEDSGDDLFDDDVADDAVDDLEPADDVNDDALQDDNNVELDLPDVHVFQQGDSFSADTSYADIEDPQTFEDLVKKKVREFILKCQSEMRCTDLSRRVKEWHDNLRPRLEKLDSRPAYDVHLYGDSILQQFPPDDRKSVVTFSSVVQDEPGEEVCRYFLSMLMLANTYNVEINSAPDSDKDRGMDNIVLTHLTDRRHHEELADFQPASSGQAGVQPLAEATNDNCRPRPTKKKKPNRKK